MKIIRANEEKLTLTIEKEISERAKVVARHEGTSISQWVEDLLREKTARSTEEWSPKPGSRTEKMLGSVSLPEDTDYKTLKEKEILKNMADSVLVNVNVYLDLLLDGQPYVEFSGRIFE